MGMKWTHEQKQVISLRNRNILVSAAAGSGKTATLVERIIQRITQGDNPIDIDRLLVVTFTKAAAAEMRERVGNAIEQKRQEQPNNQHLKRQSLLLHSAQITTIDSFCLSVIQDYFHEINLDPVFRIAEEEELTLLQHDVVMEILEEEYEQGREDFLSFAQAYGGKHQDLNLEGYVLKLYRFSESCPWPEKWLEEMDQKLETGRRLAEEPWLKSLLRITHCELEECKRINQRAQDLCNEIDGPYTYLDALQEDEDLLIELLAAKDYKAELTAFDRIKFKALSRKSMPDCDPGKKEQAKILRNQVKECLQSLKKEFYFQSFEEMEEDQKKAAIPAQVLIRLTLAFHKKFAEKKADKKVLDFSDIEHFALRILVEEENGRITARTPAKELRRHYEEIMIDEYQDSNEVQETILRSISREEEGKPNVFMVGDVKQSIYRFRLAKPELFLEKYNTYSKEDSLCQRIDLHKNFRSREEILCGINELFYKIMGKDFGQIEYDSDAALYPGASYLPVKQRTPDSLEQGQADSLSAGQGTQGSTEQEQMVSLSAEQSTQGSTEQERMAFLSAGQRGQENKVELVLLAGSKEEEQEEQETQEEELSEDQEEYNEKELEALHCARLIRNLLEEGFLVQGKGSDGNPVLRKCEYKDIVILLRTMSGWAEVFAQVLEEQGIPAAAATQSGYFNVPEIKWLLNYLRMLDNPQQDIPASNVLLSPFAGLSHNELAAVRIEAPAGQGIYENALWYEKQGEKEEIREKLQLFFEIFRKLRERSTILTVPELLAELYELTGYDCYVAAMPSGEGRYDNILMFSEKAAAFERSSYRGLFQFIRYVERLIKYEIDYGEASTESENSNAVRIMSIHKSKGLEFPIVFLCGTTKRFNLMDIREKIVFHPDQGIALDYVDEEMRTAVPTLKKKMLQNLILEETLSEELRLLYVAMTRAKEKLYLSGYIADEKKAFRKWEGRSSALGEKLYYTALCRAACYMDFIGPALKELPSCRRTIVKEEELHRYRRERKRKKYKQVQEFLYPDFNSLPYDEAKKKEIREYLMFSYPFEAERLLPVKTSVSELKKKAMEEEDFEIPALFPMQDKEGEEDYEETSTAFETGTTQSQGTENVLEAGVLKSPKTETILETRTEKSQGTETILEAGTLKSLKTETILETGTEKSQGTKNILEAETTQSQGTKTILETGTLKYQGTFPEFLKEQQELKGTDRGTLYHKVLECLPLTKQMGRAEIKKEIERLSREEKISERDLDKIDISRLERFYACPAAARMRKAKEKGKLRQEQPFVLAVPAKELYGIDSMEPILIQGIIDVFFEEGDGLVLLDYKTDYIPKNREDILIQKYSKQIELYKRALEEITGKRVLEKIIYSFSLQKEIPIR